MSATQTAPRLGLIGGLGVGAAMHYYRALAQRCTAEGRSLDLVMMHADVNRIGAYVSGRDWAGMAEYLGGLLDGLAAAGAGLGVIPAVTPHVCARELAARTPIPLVDVVQETAGVIRARGLRRVALLGSRVTVETRMFGGLGQVEVVLPPEAEIAAIHDLYSTLVRQARGTEAVRDGMTAIAQRLCARDGAEAVVLAGTDMALLFEDMPPEFPHVDCAALHLDAVWRLVGAPPPATA